MRPHLEEALRSLILADRDIEAFTLLKTSPLIHISMVCFHAQQAVEKSLKAVLFTHQIEFRRTHNLSELIQILNQHGVDTPVSGEQVNLLNKFAVTFRYDDKDIQLISCEDASNLVAMVRRFAEEQVKYAVENDVTD
jgi:HEPN domain-containing protein